MILIRLATEWELIACLEKIWKNEDNKGRSPFQTCAPFCLELEAPEDVTGSFIFQGFSRLPALLLMLPLKASVSFQELYELHFLGGDALV